MSFSPSGVRECLNTADDPASVDKVVQVHIASLPEVVCFSFSELLSKVLQNPLLSHPTKWAPTNSKS